METTIAKVINPQGVSRLVAGAVNYNGYLAKLIIVGKGKIVDQKVHWCGGDADVEEIYERYENLLTTWFNGTLVRKDNVQDEVTEFVKSNDNNIVKVIGSKYEKYLLKWGDQDGYSIRDYNAEKKKEEQIKMKTVGSAENPIFVGTDIVGHRIYTRLPENLWAIVKPFANYFKADDEDMEFLDDMDHFGVKPEEVKGWYYKDGFIEALKEHNLSVTMGGEPVNTSQDILDIEQANIVQSNKNVALHFKYLNELRKINNEILIHRRIATPEEVKQVENLPKILLHDWKGPTIYGGGKWLHLSENNLYAVYNNGMDGDDWSLNNYNTGGAGAICYIIPDGKKYLDMLNNLEKR